MAGSRPSEKEKGGGHPDPEITGGAGVRRGGGLKKDFSSTASGLSLF